MLGSLRRSGLLAAFAALALAGGASPLVLANQPALTQRAPRPVTARKGGLFGGFRSAERYGRRGAGVSMAQQQRSSRKKRGVARNRVNHR